MNYDIKDINLAKEGLDKINWSAKSMPTLSILKEELISKKPFLGKRISACLHVTSETANLMITLKELGAELWLCASNPLSTQDSVAAGLVKFFDIPVFAKKGEDNKTYYSHIEEVLAQKPVLTMDDGADLVSTLHKNHKHDLLPQVIGGTEETTTGVLRLTKMQEAGVLAYPIIAVNNAKTKFLFDNRYGTGQSTIDGILRATNILLAGKNFVISGYGWCGKGLAQRAKGMGANVIITEVDPIKALEAKMDGFWVMKIEEAARLGDVFVTTTGNCKVITKEHFLLMKDGVILANAGHFDVEIDIKGLEELAVRKQKIREYVEQYILNNNKTVNLLADGRLVNLSSAEGHPADVMDLSFSNQVLALLFLIENKDKLQNKVYTIPEEIDKRVAKLKLKTLGIEIDTLTKEQEEYLASWQLGT
jgi:adenosylhomocysteinase